MHTDLERSAAFLLRNAGPVIRYRLRREILGDLDAASEASLLAEICELPLFRRLLTYVKPDGYIGSGMHSWDNWRGAVLHETPLQDGECAARLLSYYRIPKTHPGRAEFCCGDAGRGDAARGIFLYPARDSPFREPICGHSQRELPDGAALHDAGDAGIRRRL